MNKEICLSTMESFSTFQKSHIQYREFIKRLKEEGVNLSLVSLAEIREASKNRLEQLETLKMQVSKLEGVLHPDTYKQISSSIENEIALASMLQQDCYNYISTQDSKYFESIVAGLTEEEEYSSKLDSSFRLVESQFGILIVDASLRKNMSLEEIRELADSLEKGTNLQKNMEHFVHYLESKMKKEATTKDEQKEQEPNKENSQATLPKQDEPTLQDKINGVNYSSDGNMVAEVQALTVEDRLKQISTSLSKLVGKEKISLKEMIEIQSLQAEQLELEAYVNALDNQKLSRSEVRRNRRMEAATNKLEENRELLRQSLEKSNQYSSKIARFFSARYQEQLASKIVDLKNKRGTLQASQRMSAIAKYNRNSGRIARKSQFIGTIKGMKQFANMKVDELRALREKVVSEFQNMQQDIQRFKSDKSLIPELKQKNIIMLDQNISISEHANQMQYGV